MEWIEGKAVSPPGQIIQTLSNTDEIKRDEHVDAMGGVRILQLDVTTSRINAATPTGRPSWYCGMSSPFSAMGREY